jgi:hypothetical protein
MDNNKLGDNFYIDYIQIQKKKKKGIIEKFMGKKRVTPFLYINFSSKMSFFFKNFLFLQKFPFSTKM